MNYLISMTFLLLLTTSAFAQNKENELHFFANQYIIKDLNTAELTTIKPSVYKADIWIKEKGLTNNPTLKIKIHSGVFIDDILIYVDIIETSGSYWYKYVGTNGLSRVILSSHDLSKIGKFQSASKMIRIDDSVNNKIFVIGF